MEENPTLPIESPTVKEKSTIKRPRNWAINKKLEEYEHVLDVLISVAAAKKEAATIGYDDAKVNEGLALLKNAKSLSEAQAIAKARAKTMTEVREDLRKQVNRDYMAHVKVVRLGLKNQEGLLDTLNAAGQRKRPFSQWRVDVEAFYANALTIEEVKLLLADNKVDDKVLKACQKKLSDLLALDNDRAQQQTDAKRLTLEKSEALTAIGVWISDFRQTVRARFYHDPHKRVLFGV